MLIAVAVLSCEYVEQQPSFYMSNCYSHQMYSEFPAHVTNIHVRIMAHQG